MGGEVEEEGREEGESEKGEEVEGGGCEEAPAEGYHQDAR